MFDVTSRISYKTVLLRFKALTYARKKANLAPIPIVILGNKVDVDVRHRKVGARMITFPRKHNLQYFDISVKANCNMRELFLWMARKLLAEQEPMHAGPPSLALLAEKELAASYQQQHAQALEAASKQEHDADLVDALCNPRQSHGCCNCTTKRTSQCRDIIL